MTNKFSMSKYMILTAAVLCTAAVKPVVAQIDSLPDLSAVTAGPVTAQSTAAVTPPATVAMIYHKLSAKVPDFSAWAAETDAYKAAGPLEKEMALQGVVAELKSAYTLTTLSEPILIQKSITLAPYSFRNEGFTIDEFNDDAYFPYSYGGQNYAVIVPTLSNYQWIEEKGDAARILEQTAEKNGRQMVATIFIAPNFADATNSMQLDENDYWLISGQIKRLVISAPGSAKPLWERSVVAPGENSTPPKEILDLYQK